MSTMPKVPSASIGRSLWTLSEIVYGPMKDHFYGKSRSVMPVT